MLAKNWSSFTVSNDCLHLQCPMTVFCTLNYFDMLITGSNQYGSILGHTSVTTGSLLDDSHWHSVVIERYRRNVNFTLDRHTQHFRTNGEFDHLDLDYEVRQNTVVCPLRWMKNESTLEHNTYIRVQSQAQELLRKYMYNSMYSTAAESYLLQKLALQLFIYR